MRCDRRFSRPRVDQVIRPVLMIQPIPSYVYFNSSESNFYHMDTRRGMGDKFFTKWFPRKDEFPVAPTNGDEQ